MAFRIEEDGYFAGAVRFKEIAVQAGAFDDDDIAASADIAATKLEHQHALNYSQADGSDVVAAIVPIHIVRGTAGTIVAFEVVCVDAPSGGDKTFTVDLLIADAGTPSPASVLTGAVTYPNGTADCTVRTGTISSATLADGDTLLVQVAVSGSTGNQGQGLIVTTTIREDA